MLVLFCLFVVFHPTCGCVYLTFKWNHHPFVKVDKLADSVNYDSLLLLLLSNATPSFVLNVKKKQKQKTLRIAYNLKWMPTEYIHLDINWCTMHSDSSKMCTSMCVCGRGTKCNKRKTIAWKAFNVWKTDWNSMQNSTRKRIKLKNETHRKCIYDLNKKKSTKDHTFFFVSKWCRMSANAFKSNRIEKIIP